MDNSATTDIQDARAKGGRYIRVRPKRGAERKQQKAAAAEKKAGGKLTSRYIRTVDSRHNDKKSQSRFVRNKKEDTVNESRSRFVRDSELQSTAASGKYFVTRDSSAHWLRRATVISIYLYIASIYVIAYTQYNIISRGLFLVMVFLTVLNTLISRTSARMDLPNVLMALFMGYALLSSFWVVSQEGVDERLSTLFQLAVLYFVIRLNIGSMKDVRMILNAIIAGTLIMCVYTVYYYGIPYIANAISTGARIGQEINQVNGMGMYCAILITIMFYLIVYEKKWLYLLCMPLAIFVQLGCGSRKGFMLVLVGVFVVAFFRAGNKKLLFLFATLTIAAFLVYIIYAMAETNYFFYRLSQVLALVDDDVTLTENSITVRKQMMDYGIQLFRQKPIQGYGLMQFEYFYSLIYGSRRPPHSTYIQILVSFGSIGFFIYYGIYMYFIKSIVPMLKKNIRYIILFAAIIMVMLFNDFGANMLNHKYSYIFLAIISSYVLQAKSLNARGLTDDPEDNLTL